MSTQEKILQTALELFSSRGYDSVGIQEIVDTVGITKPTLYHHFGSKEGLLDAILDLYFREMRERVFSKTEYKHDLTANLNEIAKELFLFANESPHFFRLELALVYAAEENKAKLRVKELLNNWNARLEQLFYLASEDHGNMKGRQKEYAASYLGLLNTYIYQILNGLVAMRDDLPYKVVHQFMHGIFS